MTQPLVAIVEDRSHIWREEFEQILAARGCETHGYDSAVTAIRAMAQIPYDGVIMEVKLPPGPDCDDEIIRRVMEQGRVPDSLGIEYWRIGLRVMELAHQSGSPNANTPFLIYSVHEPEDERIFPNARQTCLERGAVAYHCKSNPRLGTIVNELMGLMRKPTGS